jgi:hypothetical protein
VTADQGNYVEGIAESLVEGEDVLAFATRRDAPQPC